CSASHRARHRLPRPDAVAGIGAHISGQLAQKQWRSIPPRTGPPTTGGGKEAALGAADDLSCLPGDRQAINQGLPRRWRDAAHGRGVRRRPCRFAAPSLGWRQDPGSEIPMRFANGVAAAVGRTPLIKLKRASEETGCTILGKAEFMNPGQSVKDRAALYIIE